MTNHNESYNSEIRTGSFGLSLLTSGIGIAASEATTGLLFTTLASGCVVSGIGIIGVAAAFGVTRYISQRNPTSEELFNFYDQGIEILSMKRNNLPSESIEQQHILGIHTHM